MSWDSNLLAVLLREKIKDNTKEGIDKDGNPFKAYSTKPFAMPSGAVANKQKMKKVTDTKRTKKGIVSFHKTKKGSLWVTWLNGYKEYKRIMFGQSDKVNLFNTGNMVDSFAVLRVKESKKNNIITKFGDLKSPIPTEVKITLGWKGPRGKELSKIAGYNRDKGRDMLGLPQTDINKIIKGMIDKIK